MSGLLIVDVLSSNILPHDEQDGRTDQTKLNGARKEKRTAIFQNFLHDVASTLDMVRGMHDLGGVEGRILLAMVAHKYLMLGLQDDHLDPDTEIGCDHVHQA